MINFPIRLCDKLMRLIFLLAVFLIGNLSADRGEDDGDEKILHPDQKAVFISLGSHCEVARFLKDYNLRTASFPFDWLVSTIHKGVIASLDDHFLHFIDETYLTPYPIYPYMILNTCYYIQFRHTWPFTDRMINPTRHRQHIDEIQSKFKRRIARFEQLAEYSGKVFFLRAAYDLAYDPDPYWGIENIAMVTAAQAEELRDALYRFFPNLDFKLIIINYKEENTPPILGIDRVVEFKIRKTHKPQDYANLFNMLTTSN